MSAAIAYNQLLDVDCQKKKTTTKVLRRGQSVASMTKAMIENKKKCPADRRGAKCFHNGIILIVNCFQELKIKKNN